MQKFIKKISDSHVTDKDEFADIVNPETIENPESMDIHDESDDMENLENDENDGLEMKIEMEEFESNECLEPTIKLKEEEEWKLDVKGIRFRIFIYLLFSQNLGFEFS